jgi:molybdopterin molybdotransferase
MADEDLELDVGPAQATVLELIGRIRPLGRELVAIDQAGARTLAEALHAAGPLPSAPLSIMDGYALRSADLQGRTGPIVLALAGESAAGHVFAPTMQAGTCVRISTGAVVPAGADAVVAQEDTRRLADAIEFSPLACAQVEPGRWIRAIGSDVHEHALLLEAGSELGPGELALLAACGHVQVPVRVRPKVAILASGDELLAIGQTPGPGQIVATNGLMLAEQIRAAGAEPLDLGRVADRPEALRAAVIRAMHEADLLIATGGISVGDHDLVLPVLRELGVELRFRRVRLRPGRPSTLGVLPIPGVAPTLLPVLALPGNPAATLVGFELLARPLLRAMLGLPRRRWFRRVAELELAGAVEGDRKRDHYVRVQIDDQGRAAPLDRQLSGSLRSIADFDALVIVPAGRERVAAGERLQALILR